MVYWLPVLIWMGVIFLLSSQPYEAQDLRPWFRNHVNEERIEKQFGHIEITYDDRKISIQSKGVAGFLDFVARKTAHLTVFGLLSFLLLRAFWRGHQYPLWKAIISAVILSLLYACTDEWHQMYTIHRTPKGSNTAKRFRASLG